MKFHKILVLATTAVVIMTINSCTIQKRRYNSGFHIELFSHSNGKADTQKPQTDRSQDRKLRNDEIDYVYLPQSTTPFTITGSESLSVTPLSLIQVEQRTDMELAPGTHSEIKNNSATSRAKVEYVGVSDLDDSRSETETSDAKREKKSATGMLIGWSLLTLLGGGAFLRMFRRTAMRVTKWASSNLGLSQVLIGLTELGLIGSTLWMGYNLGEMGYSMSSMTTYGGLGLIGTGLLAMPLFKRKSTILPSKLNLRRIGFIAVGIGSMLVALKMGNGMTGSTADGPIQKMVQTIDQHVLSAGAIIQPADKDPGTIESTTRKSAAGITSIGASALLILLSFALCIGVCAVGFGIGITIENVMYLWAGGILGGVALIAAGVLITHFTLKGIRKVVLDEYGIEDISTE